MRRRMGLMGLLGTMAVMSLTSCQVVCSPRTGKPVAALLLTDSKRVEIREEGWSVVLEEARVSEPIRASGSVLGTGLAGLAGMKATPAAAVSVIK